MELQPKPVEPTSPTPATPGPGLSGPSNKPISDQQAGVFGQADKKGTFKWVFGAAVAVVLGMAFFSSGNQDQSHIEVLSKSQAMAAIEEMPISPVRKQSLTAAVEKETMEIWRFSIGSSSAGQGESYTVGTSGGTRKYTIAAEPQAFDLPVRSGTPSFFFSANQDNAKPGMKSDWRTPAGRYRYEMTTGHRVEVPAR